MFLAPGSVGRIGDPHAPNQGGLVPPAGYIFLIDSDGYYLTDAGGYYLVEPI